MSTSPLPLYPFVDGKEFVETPHSAIPSSAEFTFDDASFDAFALGSPSDYPTSTPVVYSNSIHCPDLGPGSTSYSSVYKYSQASELAGYDNMLGLDWNTAAAPTQTVEQTPIPNISETLPSLGAQPNDLYSGGIGELDIAPLATNGASDSIYPSLDLPVNVLTNTSRCTQTNSRKATSSTTRSARSASSKASRRSAFTRAKLASQSPSSSSTSELSSYSGEDDATFSYKPRHISGTGTPNFTSINDSGDFQCETCAEVYKSNRFPDFERHVITHYPAFRGGPLLCCGYPLEQGLAMIARGEIPKNAKVRRFYGQLMVGGCGLTLCRTDALRRHLRGRNSCVGDLKGEWHPPARSTRS
ncbi:hypothetical protein BDY19DRAFT_994605 [Irpex rosettiformis]|uniref:Uncharacterized protein n=1 Tax=Irpex rosettiformis TaxID=378272 RepID=A0ACB8U0L5_9APHY|nr:hypothetical protein BDY19DRAFT_994605 [Irpex rosettiformis]